MGSHLRVSKFEIILKRLIYQNIMQVNKMDSRGKNKNRVLEVIFKDPVSIAGGVEKYAVSLGINLSKSGYDIEYAYVFDYRIRTSISREDFKRQFSSEVSFVEFKIRKLWNILGLTKLIYHLRLKKFIIKNSERFSIIHINGDNGGRFPKKVKAMKVMTWHGISNFNYTTNKNLILKYRTKIQRYISFFMEKSASKSADIVTCVSKALIPVIKKYANSRMIYYTPPCVRNDLFYPLNVSRKALLKSIGLDPDFRYALFVGRDPERKGLLTAIRSVNECDGLRLVAVIPENFDLQKKTERVIVKNNILSYDLNRLYNACDLFLFPSKSEGLPTVVIESMSVGLVPVMFSNIAESIPEIKPGINALVVVTEDEFIAAVRKIWNDVDLIENMSEAAIKDIREAYSCEILMKKFEDLIKYKQKEIESNFVS